MRMPSALNRIAWYGRGKFGNYPDQELPLFSWESTSVAYTNLSRTTSYRKTMPTGAIHAGSCWETVERWKIQVKGLQPYVSVMGSGQSWGRRPRRERTCARTARTRLHQPEYRLQHTRVGGNDGWGAQTIEAICCPLTAIAPTDMGLSWDIWTKTE